MEKESTPTSYLSLRQQREADLVIYNPPGWGDIEVFGDVLTLLRQGGNYIDLCLTRNLR
jgi:hypothetical protein